LHMMTDLRMAYWPLLMVTVIILLSYPKAHCRMGQVNRSFIITETAHKRTEVKVQSRDNITIGLVSIIRLKLLSP
ncbi:MAG: hypothetical protein FD167_6042, partial [bacterium]